MSGTSWARLGATLEANGNTIVLDREVDWLPGDEIVITPTGWYPSHHERFTLASNLKDDKKTFILDSAARYKHWGQLTSLVQGKLPSAGGKAVRATEPLEAQTPHTPISAPPTAHTSHEAGGGEGGGRDGRPASPLWAYDKPSSMLDEISASTLGVVNLMLPQGYSDVEEWARRQVRRARPTSHVGCLAPGPPSGVEEGR